MPQEHSAQWLDPLALVERILPSILHEQNGVPARSEFCDPGIKYFTAPILSSFARSEDSVVCQAQYHPALRGHLGRKLEIISGYHDVRPARAHLKLDRKPANESPIVEIWKLEEKQSDVALALHPGRRGPKQGEPRAQSIRALDSNAHP